MLSLVQFVFFSVYIFTLELIAYFFLSNQEVYDIDDAAFNWFLGTAGMKWKEFKSTVKKQFFDEKISDEELRAKHRDRVNDDDWKFLSNYWRSPESEVSNQY